MRTKHCCPSLIASVVSYVTLAFFLGAQPVFAFTTAAAAFRGMDLLWSAILGVLCGFAAMVFAITFRRARTFMVNVPIPHWLKMMLGGILTGVCGLAFLGMYHGSLIPIGPNYEAVPLVLVGGIHSRELVVFGVIKLIATICSLAVGGVSAMFVPLFLSGGSFGVAFAQSIAHSPDTHLYAAVGMAAFIAGAYKTPLTAVVFVAEATGGHPYIIPALIGAAVSYAVSGEASVSGDQRLHEAVRVADLGELRCATPCKQQVISARANSTLREFVDHASAHHLHAAYPVLEDGQPAGVIAMRSLGGVPSAEWQDSERGIADGPRRNSRFARMRFDRSRAPDDGRQRTAHASRHIEERKARRHSHAHGCAVGAQARKTESHSFRNRRCRTKSRQRSLTPQPFKWILRFAASLSIGAILS